MHQLEKLGRALLKSKSQPHKADVAKQSDLMLGLMDSVVAFMIRTGIPKREIHEIFARCLTGGATSRKKIPAAVRKELAYGCDTIAGAVLRAWHKLPKYLDSAARPLALRMDGVEPSLTSLILSQEKDADPEEITRSMLNAGLLKKKGLRSYLPEKDSATIESLDPLSIDHIAKTVIRLVETASQNISKSREKPKLIERYAHVPDLSKSQAKAFADFSSQQGQACLDAIEDWLESRQVKSAHTGVAGNDGINAGVHIFAYLGSSPSARKKESQRQRGRGATSPREARV